MNEPVSRRDILGMIAAAPLAAIPTPEEPATEETEKEVGVNLAGSTKDGSMGYFITTTPEKIPHSPNSTRAAPNATP